LFTAVASYQCVETGVEMLSVEIDPVICNDFLSNVDFSLEIIAFQQKILPYLF